MILNIITIPGLGSTMKETVEENMLDPLVSMKASGKTEKLMEMDC